MAEAGNGEQLGDTLDEHDYNCLQVGHAHSLVIAFSLVPRWIIATVSFPAAGATRSRGGPQHRAAQVGRP